MIEPYDWVLLNETEEENTSLIEDLRGIIPTNMLRDFERFVYYNSDLKKYLMLHRTLVDPQYSIFHKNYSKIDPFSNAEDGDDVVSIDKHILQQKDLDLSNFSLDPNSLLERHRLLVQKREKKQKEITETNNPFNQTRIVLKRALETTHSSLILLKGGDFSIVLKYKDQTVFHKGDHKYVVRKKQGGRQIIKGKGMNSAGGQIRWNNELLHREAIRHSFKEDLPFRMKDFDSEKNGIIEQKSTINDGDLLEAKKVKKDSLVSQKQLQEDSYHQIAVGTWIREGDWLFVHAPGENKMILFGDQASQLKGGGDGSVLGGKSKDTPKTNMTKAARMLNIERNNTQKPGLFQGEKESTNAEFLEDLTGWEGVRSLGKGGMSQGIGKPKLGESEKVWEEVTSIYIIAEEDFCA